MKQKTRKNSLKLHDIIKCIIPNLIVLLIATLLSIYIVPKLTYKSQIKQIRIKKALEIIDRNTEIDRKINIILTVLEFFQKDLGTKSFKLFDYKEKQKDLRETFIEKYIDFDNVAWWWYGNISIEAKILGFASEKELNRIKHLIENYEKNLIENTEVIEYLRHIFLREDFNPENITNVSIMKNTREKINKLRQDRLKIISDLSYILSMKKSI